MKAHLFFRVVLGAVAVTLAMPAIAQNSGADSSETSGLHDIVVTAQKRSESAQSTPLSIGVVTGEEIAKRAQPRLEDVLRDTPGVQVQDFAQGAQIYIRGVGSQIDPVFADASVALMNDGVYNGRTESVQSGGFDIDRVEIARGPQGTLYGRNANGGVVNVLTKNPSTSGFDGYVRGQVGNYGLWRGEGAVNLPLGDVAAVRVAAFREKRNGYIDDGSQDSDKFGVRGKLLLKPTEWLTIIGKVEFAREKGKGNNTVPVPGSGIHPGGGPFPALGIFPPPLLTTNFNPPVAFATNPPGACPGSPFVGCAPVSRFPNGWNQRNPNDPWSNDPEHPAGSIDRKSTNYSAEINADLGFATLTLLPSYTRNENSLASSFLFGTLTGPYNVQAGTTTYKSIEARLASNSNGPFKYVLGVYYLNAGTTGLLNATTQVSDQGNVYTVGNLPQPSNTYAVFGQVTYSITDQFRVTGGLRYSEDKNAQSFIFASGAAATAPVAFSNKQSATQYKVGIEYDLAERSLLYAHVASGFKQGGLNTTIPPIPFQPERLTAYELGIKNRFLDNTLQVNVAGFYYTYENYQYSSPLTLPLGNLTIGGVQQTASIFGVVQNAGKTHISGAELEVDYAPWHLGRLNFSVNYLDAKYGTACLGSNPFFDGPGTVPDAGCTAALPHSVSGRQIQNSPKWSGNIGIEQGVDLGNGALTFGATMHWSSSSYVSVEQFLPGAVQTSYTRSDATIRYSAPDDKWSLGVWMHNIEGKAQNTGLFPAYRRFISSPRTFGASAEFKF
jgi:iron complex outermembrane receptor protein